MCEVDRHQFLKKYNYATFSLLCIIYKMIQCVISFYNGSRGIEVCFIFVLLRFQTGFDPLLIHLAKNYSVSIHKLSYS